MMHTLETSAKFRLLMTALITIALAACGPKDSVYTGHITGLGSPVDITIVGVPVPEAQEAIAALEADFRYMEAAWSPTAEGALALANERLTSGQPFSAPPSLIPLIHEARRIEELTDGLVNPALGNLLRLWGFYASDPENFRPPAIDEVTTLLKQSPSMSDITVEGYRMRGTNAEVALDFDGFLKGYAIDQAVQHLRELGIKNVMINAGGDLRAIGSRAGHPWHVTIRRPDGTGVLSTLDLRGDESIITVGAYERYLTWKGTHYHHIVDPRTGWPADRTRSVTVIHPNATTAHAAATAMFIAGPDGWVNIASRMGIDQVLLMDTSGTLHLTPQIRERLRFLEKTPPVIIADPNDDGSDAL